ncbi:rod shape-determining protein MreC [Nonomuraea sp. NPDC059194]|uniref:rod shape-determining protein MreC n=1 Tax=Nonomuraea sp. NPDC059194 TaxID=3346764 RepID=UPI0036B30A05
MRDTRRARLILGLLLTVALVVLTIDHRASGSSPFGILRGVGSSLFGAAERFVAGVVTPVSEFVGAIAGAPGARDRIKQLEAQNAKLRADLATSGLDRARSAELRKLLGTSQRGGYTVVPANVVARRGHPGFEDAIEIDAGTSDGIRAEMTVINGDGLVGRVVRATASNATVMLLSDPASSAGARLEGANEIGVIHGVGEYGRLVQFRLLDSTARLTPGTRIVSFGSQRGVPYVPGVPIGVIERVEATPGELTRIAYARPFANLSALDAVGVVVAAPKRDPRDAVLPRSAGER